MSQHVFKPQINTLTDRANYVVHGAACAATFVAIGYTAGPAVAATALAGSFLFNYVGNYFFNQKMKESFPATTKADLPIGSEELPDEISRMSKELGMPSPPLLVYDRYPTNSPGGKSAIKDAFDKVFYNHANVAAIGTNTFNLLASTPLLKELTSDEEEVVMAHELAHIKAGHVKQLRNLKVLNIATRLTGWANYVIILYSSLAGVEALGVGIASSFAARLVLRKIGLDPKNNESHKALVKSVAKIVQTGGVLGVSALQGRMDVLAAWGVAKVLTTASTLVASHASRSREYQADRLAAETTSDPLSLASALHKVDSYNHSVSDEGDEEKEVKKKLEGILEIFSTHPTTEKRCRRLEQKAKRLEERSLILT